MHEIFPTKSEKGQEKNSYLRMATIRLNSHSGRYLKFVKQITRKWNLIFDYGNNIRMQRSNRKQKQLA